MGIHFSRLQDSGREVSLVRGVREVLCFKAKTMVLIIYDPIFSSQAAVKEVTRIKLYAGLRSKNFH